MSRFYTVVPRCSCMVALIVSLLLGVFGVGQNAFARPPENEEEALQCMLYVTAFNTKNEEVWGGSAFIVEENGVFWIYTNAHNLAGAARIEFLDFKGAKLKGFGKSACYSDAAGVITRETPDGKKYKLDCDGVKIELKEKRLLGFEFEKDPINVGDEVITLGDKGGAKTMDILEGKISKVTSKTLQTTCKTAGGCSGGALVLKDSWRVIGLHTWGLPGSVKTLDLLWSDGRAEKRYAGASRIDTADWIFMSARDFMKGSKLHK
ncbi:serine protease [bacterium]|nr:serine protease [bacterium]